MMRTICGGVRSVTSTVTGGGRGAGGRRVPLANPSCAGPNAGSKVEVVVGSYFDALEELDAVLRVPLPQNRALVSGALVVGFNRGACGNLRGSTHGAE